MSSTFREVFRQESGLNPWGTIDWILPEDDEYIEEFHPSDYEKRALIHSNELGWSPSQVASRAFSIVASRVLNSDERSAVYEAAAEEIALSSDADWEDDWDYEPTRPQDKRVPGVGTMLRRASTAHRVTEILGPSYGPAVVISGLAVVLARALTVAQDDVTKGRPDFGVASLTSVVGHLLALAQATALLRRSLTSGQELAASEQNEIDRLTGKLDQYREYIWSSVASYDMLRDEHIAATQAIESDIAQIRKEDQRWADLVTATEIIASVDPPPGAAGQPRRISAGPSAHRSLEAVHGHGCRCREC